MDKKLTKGRSKKWLWFVGIAVVALGAGVVYVLPRLQSAKAANTTTIYRTQLLAKGDLSSTVGATGNVYPRQSVTMNWKTSGTVSKVYVTKGQQVTAGTVLAELDPSSLPQDVLNAATTLATAQQDLDDLLNSNTARANAQLALITAEQDLVAAQKTAQSKLYQRASQETIDIAHANLIQAQAALDRATDIYNQNKSRASDDVQYAAALSQFASAQQKFDSAQLNYQYAQALPDPLAVQAANASLDVAQAKYLDAKRAWERVKDGPPATDVAAAEAKVTAAQAILDEAKIVAPISGTITAIDTQPGDLVSAQTSAFDIADQSHLYVDISVSEVDVSQVQVGQPVEITFDAISGQTYQGVVTDMAMQGTSSSGTVNYPVTAEITNPDAKILNGMTAAASITVTQKTGVLLVPSSAIRTVSGQQLVYVMQNNTPQAISITTGDTSGTQTEVTGGNLTEGEAIILNPPSSTTTSTASRGLFGGIFGGVFGGDTGPREFVGPPGNFQPGGQGNSQQGGSTSGQSGNTQSR
jgi:HlyD family secretion protein